MMRPAIYAQDGSLQGNIPYVTHLDHRVPPAHLHAIPSFPHPDEDLSREDRAEALSWVAYIDERVTDLIVRVLSIYIASLWDL